MTSGEVLDHLSNRFCQPEWSFATELALMPGFSSRRADAVAMNNWTSGRMGCAIFGFEVKVSRSDFLHELKQPKKRVETYLGVDGLFLACPSGLVRPEEVPADMGIVYCSDAGARFQRMPDPCILPAKASETKRQQGNYQYTVRQLDLMPPVERGLAVAVLRAFHADRDKDLQRLDWRLNEARIKLLHARRDLLEFPEGFADAAGA